MKIINKVKNLFAGAGNSKKPPIEIKEKQQTTVDPQEEGFYLNQKAMQYEKDQDISNAIKYYELCIQSNFEGSHPYNRLAILYRKQKDYNNEIRVIEQAISIFTDIKSKGYREFELTEKINKFQDRLSKAKALREKQKGH